MENRYNTGMNKAQEPIQATDAVVDIPVLVKKKTKPRKRCTDLLYADTLIGRVVNLTEIGKNVFQEMSEIYGSAMRYATNLLTKPAKKTKGKGKSKPCK